MAQLGTPALPEPWTASQARAQYFAVAWLRWRIFLNGLRRKGGMGDILAYIVSIPIAIVFVLGPSAGAGFLSWYFASDGRLPFIAFILLAMFAFSQLININLGQPGTTFNPTELIRFPMRLSSYVAMRLFFGLLAPANVVVAFMSLAVAIGVTVAIPSLWLAALLAMMIFALTNVLFTRMVFAWIDRWMSTRRAREVFTGLIFTMSLGFQYINVAFNPAYGRHHHADPAAAARLEMLQHAYHLAEPILNVLPPALAGQAVVDAHYGRYVNSIGSLVACAGYACLFLAIFVLRTRTEFHGENLSDAANAVPREKPTAAPARALQLSPATPAASTPQRGFLWFSPGVTALFGREFLYLRRNTGMFYGLIAPLVMVILFAGKFAVRHPVWWTFPAAAAYSMIGIAPLAYNSFGMDGAGTQFYFMAPVRLGDVFLAKNLMNFLLAVVETAAVYGIILYSAPPTLEMVVAGVLWVAGTLFFSTTVGNYRSVSAPKKINLNRAAGKQASPLSALISIGLVLVAGAFGAGILFIGHEWLPWLTVPALLLYALAGLFVYVTTLRTLDHYALDHREDLFEELCKQS